MVHDHLNGNIGPCPTVQEWHEAIRGRVNQTRWRQFESHLIRCARCEATIDAITEESDTCVRSLCQLPLTADDEPAFQRLYTRLVSSSDSDLKTMTARGDKPLELPCQVGNYELRAPLGHGANGSVFLARHIQFAI